MTAANISTARATESVSDAAHRSAAVRRQPSVSFILLSGVMTRFIKVKVKAHSGEPLNEAANALAGAAAEMDPTRPADVDPEGVYFYYRETLVVWSARLRQHLTQVAASQWAAKSARPVRRPDGSLGAPSTPLTTAWLLRPLQGRRMLGDALSRMKITPAKRQVLRARFLARS